MHTSVIIPFRPRGNDAGLLAWTLEGYANQILAPGHTADILLGVDGDETPVPAPPEKIGPLTCSFHIFPRMGAAAVRNALVRLSSDRTDLLLFTNADCRPAPTLLQTHAGTMAKLPANSLILGSAPFEPRENPTVFDSFLHETPVLFDYPLMQPHTWHDFKRCWTLNLFLRRADFLASGGFHDELRPVFYEDIAFGYRIMQNRKSLFYQPAASVIHRHPMTLEQYMDREELLGIMAPMLAKICPDASVGLLGTSDTERPAANFRTWVEMDIPSHQITYRHFREWATSPVSSLPSGPERAKLLHTLHNLHLPFKRLAFRLGFLKGLNLTDAAHWLKRKPQGLWRYALI